MRNSSIVILLAALAATAGPRLAGAGVIEFSFANQTPVTTAGGTGTIDVVITETGSQDTLYQFQVETFLANHDGSNIALSAALETGAPVPPGSAGGYAGGTNGYVFGQDSYNNSQIVAQGLGQIGVNNPTDVQSSDADVTNGTLLGGGTQYGLMQLTFTVPTGTAAGSYALSFNQNAPWTPSNKSDDPNSDFVDLISIADYTNMVSPGLAPNGAIVVTPEPGSAVLLLLGTSVLFGFRRLRNRRS